jgi:hypothetical protein
LVFAKARCALEAMAVGAAVILCDTRGLGPMVTATEVERLRLWNFGMRLLQRPLEPARIVQEIRRYNPTDALEVSRYIRTHADLSRSITQYLQLYREVLNEPLPDSQAPSREVGDYAFSLLPKISEIEHELFQLKQPYRMEALDEDSCRRIRLSLIHAPEQVQRAQDFHVQVELENQSETPVGSFPPYPLHFSYRWFSSATDELIVNEGPRTLLRSSLLPGQKAHYTIRVPAPVCTGTQRLRITLVQEWVRWLDALTPPVCADTPISIVD